MNIGDRFKLKVSNKSALPSVAVLAGQKGVIIEKVKYIGAPLIVKMDDGSRWHCWPNELECLKS